MSKCKECEAKEIERCECCGKPILPREKSPTRFKNEEDNKHYCTSNFPHMTGGAIKTTI